MNCKDSYLVHDFSPRFSSKNLIVLIFACPGCQAPSTSHRSGDLLLLLLGLLLLVPLLLIELLCISTTTTTKPCGKTGREIHTCTKRQYMHFHSFSTGFLYIFWDAPPPSNSHHYCCYIFSKGFLLSFRLYCVRVHTNSILSKYVKREYIYIYYGQTPIKNEGPALRSNDRKHRSMNHRHMSPMPTIVEPIGFEHSSMI